MTYGEYYKIIPETTLTPEQLDQMHLHRYTFKARVLFSRSQLKAQVYLYQN